MHSLIHRLIERNNNMVKYYIYNITKHCYCFVMLDGTFAAGEIVKLLINGESCQCKIIAKK